VSAAKAKRNRSVRLAAAVLAGAMAFSFGCSTVLKKSPPKRSPVPQYAHPTYPGLNPPKKKEPKPWFGSWFRAKEPEKPKTVSQWMEQNKRIDP